MSGSYLSAKSVVALDFDGVLCDSLPECMLVAYLAYQAMQNNKIINIHDIKIPDATKNFFKKYRGFVRPAREFFILLDLHARKIEPISLAIFNQEIQQKQTQLNEFEEIFFRIREQLKNEDNKLWSELNSFFPDVIAGLQQLAEKYELCVVSTKDEKSINQLLAYHKVKAMSVYGKDKIKEQGSKRKIIESLIKEKKLMMNALHFIDDNEEYLNELNDLPIKIYHAAWGYSCFADKPARAIVCDNFKDFVKELL